MVVEVYSNSSSAPNSASSTLDRRPSLSASARPAPTIATSSSRPRRFLRLGGARRVSAALLSESAATLRSFWTFLSSRAFVRALPVHAAIGLARGLESRAQVVAQGGVLHQPLHVWVATGRLTGCHCSGSRLRGLLFRCHSSPQLRLPSQTLPGLRPGHRTLRPPAPEIPVDRACPLRGRPGLHGLFGLQGRVQHVVDVVDEDELQLLEQVRREVLEVGLVAARARSRA